MIGCDIFTGPKLAYLCIQSTHCQLPPAHSLRGAKGDMTHCVVGRNILHFYSQTLEQLCPLQAVQRAAFGREIDVRVVACDCADVAEDFRASRHVFDYYIEETAEEERTGGGE